MGNKGGKGLITIIVLGVFIILAVVPWFFVVTNLFGIELFAGSDENGDGDLPAYVSQPEQDIYDGSEDDQTEIPEEVIDEPELPEEEDDTPQTTNDPIANVEMTVNQISSAHSDIYRELNNIASEHNAVGVGVVAFDGNAGEFYTFEFGFADRENGRRVSVDTQFRVASLTKIVTAIAVMTLVDDGLIDLDTDISTYFGFEVRNVHFPGTPITARMLLQHTSSIFDSGAFQVSRDRGSSESVRLLLERGTSFRRNEPGSNFEYTNFGYAVLSALAERVSGKTLDSLAREVIFEPLGIDAAFVAENLYNTESIAVIYNDRHGITRSIEAQLNVRETGTPGHDLHLAQGNLYITLLD
jgi:CubicO group peptidase (beta-lactamase class C family)